MRIIFTFTLLLILFYQSYAQNIDITLIQKPCNNDGIIEITVNNATLPITLKTRYNDKDTTVILQNTNKVQFSNFGGGIVYSYFIGPNSVYVSNYASLPFAFSFNLNQVTAICPAKSSVELIVSQGQAPYSIDWYDQKTDLVVETGSLVYLDDGVYYFSVKDAAGCEYKATEERKDSLGLIYVNSVPSFSYDVTTKEANCTNGKASIINLNGNNPPFTYKWSNGATSSEIENLSSGVYEVTVTDASGCTLLKYEIQVPQSIVIEGKSVVTNEACNDQDGAIQMFPEGGTPPYFYKWSHSTNLTSNTASNLGSGYYYVEIIDSKGCVGYSSTYVGSLSPIIAEIKNNTPSACNENNGSVTIEAKNGTLPYEITWDHDGSHNFTADQLAPGYYYFTVKDGNDCIKKGSVYVINNPQLYAYYSNVVHPTCDQPNGTIEFEVQGGQAPYSYLWSDGSIGSKLLSAKAGYHTVTISDAQGCSIIKSTFLSSYSPLELNFATTNASCIYTADGSVTASIINGTPPYTYNWSSGENTNHIDGKLAGKYYLSVVDALGCTGFDMVTIDYNQSNSSCYCEVSGKIYLDSNNNCVLDPTEEGIKNIQLNVDRKAYTYTNDNGIYSFKLKNGSYRLSETIRNQYPLSSCAENFIDLTISVNNSCNIEYNIPHNLNPLHDVAIGLWSKDKPIAGYGYNQRMIITNKGTIEEPIITARHTVDLQLPSLTSSPLSLIPLINNTWQENQLPMLKPGESHIIDLNYPIAPTIPLNTELVFSDSCAYQSPISDWVLDYAPADNVILKTESVVGSFDPNMMEVLPVGKGAEGYIPKEQEDMQYMVHFQNVGNWYAKKVEVVIDLNENIDISSITPVYESHGVTSISITEDKKMIYKFENVNLYPKEWNEVLSQGMLTFSCKLKKNLNEGTKISNQADIFFDFNIPVTTNKTINTIETVAKVSEINQDRNLLITPNPSSTDINIEVDNKERFYFTVINSEGKTIIQTHEFKIAVSNLPAGIYYVIAQGEYTRKSSTFLKI